MRDSVCCCGISGIMMRLKIIKEETDYSSIDTDEENAVLLYGMKLLKDLISSWSGSGRRVCVDSYFASIQVVDVMVQEGLKFIGKERR